MKKYTLFTALIFATILGSSTESIDQTGSNDCSESEYLDVKCLVCNTLNVIWDIGYKRIFNFEDTQLYLLLERVIGSTNEDLSSDQKSIATPLSNEASITNLKNMYEEFLFADKQIISQDFRVKRTSMFLVRNILFFYLIICFAGKISTSSYNLKHWHSLRF